jgi:hypothetical protein
MLMVGQAAEAADPRDVDALTTYAVLLGRAVACGVDTDDASRRVGRWMDKRFTPEDQKTYLPVFAIGTRYHAQMQKDGKSPDSCAKVRSEFAKIPWP